LQRVSNPVENKRIAQPGSVKGRNWRLAAGGWSRDPAGILSPGISAALTQGFPYMTSGSYNL